MTLFVPSRFQAAVFDFIENGTGDLVLNAVAGSGKTKTLEEATKRLPSRILRETGMSAFNKHIEQELVARKQAGKIPSEVSIFTIHGFGRNALYEALRPRNSRNWLDANKYRKLTRLWFEMNFAPHELADDDVIAAQKAAETVVRFAMCTLTPRKDRDLDKMAAHYDIDMPNSMVEHVYDCARQVIGWGSKGLPRRMKGYSEGEFHPKTMISFDDMVFLPNELNLTTRTFKMLMVDEAQDLNRAQLELMLKAKGTGRAIFVGDKCQPTGTMVAVAGRGYVPIEDLAVGDMVISYTPSDCAFVKRGRKVLGITERSYNGRMIVVSVDGKVSRYTPSHHCLANFAPLANEHAVYLMRRGLNFRVGVAKLNYGTACGPLARMRAENADAVWVLETHESPVTARIREAAIAGRFGLPQLMFTEKNAATIFDTAALEHAWDFIGVNTDRAVECLEFFGREIDYPLFSSDDTPWAKSMRRPMVVHAANLMDGALMLPFNAATTRDPNGNGSTTHTRRADWKPVTLATEHYTGSVFSLTVDGEHLYVADGIVTHNCQAIYGFAGADAESFANIQKRTGAAELPLSITYRCPKAVVEIAQRYVPEIQAADDAAEGFVTMVGEDQLRAVIVDQYNDPKTRTEPFLVLCRTNAPLVSMAFSLIKAGVPATVKGRDIGKQVVDTIDAIAKLSGFGFDQFGVFAETYRNLKVRPLMQRENTEMQVAQINDMVDCAIAIYEAAVLDERGSLGEMRSYAQDMFTDQDSLITCSSVHKAKGLEAKNVGVIRCNQMPHPMARQPWQKVQEDNLAYIAVTRSLRNLYLANVAEGSKLELDEETPVPATTERELVDGLEALLAENATASLFD